jgi:CRISPR system Cascade subunit CasE
MYLSKLVLNLRDEYARQDLNDVYELHRTLLSAFPDRDDGGPGRVLFRVENKTTRDAGAILLVQSTMRPRWDDIDRSPDYFLRQPVHKEFNPSIAKDDMFKFRLLANPTVKRNGKRVGLRSDAEQLDWIARKSDLSGFTLGRIINIPKDDVVGRKSSSGEDIVLTSVLFEGTLRVDDPTSFRDSLECGIGSGKAFGFGLLSLAR